MFRKSASQRKYLQNSKHRMWWRRWQTGSAGVGSYYPFPTAPCRAPQRAVNCGLVPHDCSVYAGSKNGQMGKMHSEPCTAGVGRGGSLPLDFHRTLPHECRVQLSNQHEIPAHLSRYSPPNNIHRRNISMREKLPGPSLKNVIRTATSV